MVEQKDPLHTISPWTPGEREIRAILADLRKPIPPRLLAHKKKGGQQLTFIPWYRAAKLLDYYAPGWEKRVELVLGQTRLYVTVSVSITASDGIYTRTATGMEELDTNSYGDPSSNAESMAFRRACANFGLGLDLYEK